MIDKIQISLHGKVLQHQIKKMHDDSSDEDGSKIMSKKRIDTNQGNQSHLAPLKRKNAFKKNDKIQDNIDLLQKILNSKIGDEVEKDQKRKRKQIGEVELFAGEGYNPDNEKNFVDELKLIQDQIQNTHNFMGLSEHEKQVLILVHKFNSKLEGNGTVDGDKFSVKNFNNPTTEEVEIIK